MNYQETLDYLFNSLPMFHRIGAAAYKSSLDTTIQLNAALNNPQLDFKSIHIAGTNGKGSSSSMIASVLQKHGYKVGLYTSPHLKDFRERIRVNGEMISKDYVTRFVEQNLLLFEELKPSFFEMTFALACEYFSLHKVDFAVMEVGMGGRLDSTNIIDSRLCLITNIGFDHTAFLGNSLALIANEKAGIIKSEIPIVIGEKHNETENVFRAKAKSLHSPLTFAEEIISFVAIEEEEGSYVRKYIINGFPGISKIEIPLLGNYQSKNICSVLATLLIGIQNNIFKLDDDSIIEGLKNVLVNTGFAGRWQILQKKPLVIADTAHNEDGLRTVISQLLSLKATAFHFVLGVVNDKDIDTILPLFPVNAHYYFCKPNIPRGLDEKQLKLTASNYGLIGNSYTSCRNAYNSAIANSTVDDIIYIGGSTFVVAELI